MVSPVPLAPGTRIVFNCSLGRPASAYSTVRPSLLSPTPGTSRIFDWTSAERLSECRPVTFVSLPLQQPAVGAVRDHARRQLRPDQDRHPSQASRGIEMAVPKDGTADYPLGASVIALAPGPLDGPGSCLPGPRAAALVR